MGRIFGDNTMTDAGKGLPQEASEAINEKIYRQFD